MGDFEKRDFLSAEQELDRFHHQANAELILEKGEGRMREEDFTDVYGAQKIGNDKKVLEALKREFEKDLDHLSPEEVEKVEAGKKMSEALELVVTQNGDFYSWFGDDVYMIRTTEYDDLVNGVDAVLEFSPETGPGQDNKVRRLALAIDTSTRGHRFSLQRKISRHSEYLTKRRKPLEVKYFQSAITGEKSRIFKIVPVVIGIEGKNANTLIDLFAQLIKLDKKSPLYQEKVEQARTHPVQVVFLEEIQEQFNYYLRLLEGRQDEESDFYRKEISKLSTRIEATLASKKHLDAESLRKDKVFLIIQELTQK